MIRAMKIKGSNANRTLSFIQRNLKTNNTLLTALEQRRADARVSVSLLKIVYGLLTVPLPDYIYLSNSF